MKHAPNIWARPAITQRTECSGAAAIEHIWNTPLEHLPVRDMVRLGLKFGPLTHAAPIIVGLFSLSCSTRSPTWTSQDDID